MSFVKIYSRLTAAAVRIARTTARRFTRRRMKQRCLLMSVNAILSSATAGMSRCLGTRTAASRMFCMLLKAKTACAGKNLFPQCSPIILPNFRWEGCPTADIIMSEIRFGETESRSFYPFRKTERISRDIIFCGKEIRPCVLQGLQSPADLHIPVRLPMKNICTSLTRKIKKMFIC